MMNNENGRSMVEMLGVLAIIGVLSVAGIAGYTIAMRKYRANEILNTASQLVVLAQTRNSGMGGIETAGNGQAIPLPAGMSAMAATCNASGCSVNGTATDSEAWNMAKGMASGAFTMS